MEGEVCAFFTLGVDAFSGGCGKEEVLKLSTLPFWRLFHFLPHPVTELLLGRWEMCLHVSPGTGAEGGRGEGALGSGGSGEDGRQPAPASAATSRDSWL